MEFASKYFPWRHTVIIDPLRSGESAEEFKARFDRVQFEHLCQQYIDAVNKLDQYDGNLKSQILQLLSDHSAEVSIRLEKFDDEFLRILHLLEKQERQKYVDAVNKLDRYPADVKARLLSNEFAKGMEKRWKKNCLCKEKVTSADKWFCSCAMDFIYIQAYIEVLQIKTTGRLRSLNRMGPDNLQSGIFEGDRAEQMLASRIDLLLKGECGLCCSKGLQQVICSCDMTELEAHVLIRCCIDLLKFQQEETGSRVLGAVLGNIGMEMAHEEVRERRSAYHNCKECKNSLNLFIRQYRLCICEPLWSFIIDVMEMGHRKLFLDSGLLALE